MKKILNPFIWVIVWIIKIIIWTLIILFVVPVGIAGVLYAIIKYIFDEARDLVEEQIYKA